MDSIMKKKIDLTELKVKSFITSLDHQDSVTIRGGSPPSPASGDCTAPHCHFPTDQADCPPPEPD